MPPFVRYIIPTETTSLDPGKEMSFGIVKLKLAAEKPHAGRHAAYRCFCWRISDHIRRPVDVARCTGHGYASVSHHG